MPANKTIYFILVLTLGILSCKKKEGPHGDGPVPVKPFVTNVYAVGFKVVSNERYGIYWKNGHQVSVTSDLNSSIDAVITVDTDVYMAGHNSAGAVYWKNGQPVVLATGAQAEAYAITVSGNDVYAGGVAYKTGDKYTRAVYWKNGVETDLTDGTAEAGIYAIVVSGADVYTAGQNNLPDNGTDAGAQVASCWKNQTLIPLDSAAVFSYGSFAKGIAVSGSDVYVAGYIGSGVVLWKNGKLQPLDANAGSPLGTSGFTVAVTSTDVYVGGEHGNEAAYWENGTIKDLITGAFVNSGVQCFGFEGNDVYMGGYLGNVPTYWKNDTAHTLQNNGEPYNVNGIAVNRHQ